MADALEQLKERLAEVTDLGKVARLLAWDQQTMMPPAGTAHRADQFSTLVRIAHERGLYRSAARRLLACGPGWQHATKTRASAL